MERTRLSRLALLILGIAMTSLTASAAETLRIKIIDAGGKTIDGAQVAWIRNEDRRVAGSRTLWTTSRDGIATFPNVLAGTHAIRVSAPGYLTVTVSGIVVEERVVPRRVLGEIVILLNRD